MTTVVPTSEEDPALAVVRFTSELAWADAGPEVPTPTPISLNHAHVYRSLCVYIYIYIYPKDFA